ncbi:hypothetical protein BDCR2A_00856 [Borrelia duttonii CR2A]|uniref:Uncharacterized protein n=2 Tax=Borrelia duttonii TaxID=40834 RepID=W6TJL3_9SPIR|nr:hypothetical protein BDCR2A_00856 [Borrelia duttonii CR2A]
MKELILRMGRSKSSGNDLERGSKFPYWKIRKARSELKKQSSSVLGNGTNNNKSVGVNSNGHKNYKGNRQKGLGKEQRSRIKFKKVCPICEKQIKDILSCMSMKFSDEDKPIHFDCAIDRLKSESQLLKNESLVYKGVGKFFVVDRSVRGNNLSFKIVKEIDFENLEGRPAWRQKILNDMNKGFKLY